MKSNKSESPVADSASAALAAVAEQEEANRQKAQTGRLEDLHRYCTLLARANHPEAGDERELAEMLIDGLITADELARDRASLEDLRRHLAFRSQKDEAQARVKLANEKRDALRKKTEQELRDAEHELAEARGQYFNSSSADREIHGILASRVRLREGRILDVLEQSPEAKPRK